MKPALIYVLYLGNLYGTERMALATVAGLAGDFEALMLAPPGRAIEAARGLGIAASAFRGYLDLARQLNAALGLCSDVAFLATRFEQSLIFWALNLVRRRKAVHYMVVHGGGGKNVYRRNVLLAGLPVRFIAVSNFVGEQLAANGIAPERIDVIGNFLSHEQLGAIPRRGGFDGKGVRKVVVISRTVRDKRIDLLLDALDAEKSLGDVSFDVFGDGEDLEPLRARGRGHPTVRFEGFDADVASRIRDYDLLLHTAPREPFGLVVLEAMAAGVPVLVPDAGGPASIVSGASGFLYRANDSRDLADQLLRLKSASAEELNRVVANAFQSLQEHFSEACALARYRNVLRRPAGHAARHS